MVLPRFNPANYAPLHILHFGIEIEGLYDSEYDDRDDDGDGERYNEYFRHDGSVEARDTYEGDTDDTINGEIVSAKYRIDRLLQFRLFPKQNQCLWVDLSCGLHIHASTNNALAYQKLCDLEFYKQFRKQSWQFMHNGLFCDKTVELFEERFNGKSQYCLSGFNPDKSINSGMREFSTIYTSTNGRYNDMNFDSYHKFGTVECRLFPSSANPDEIISMVEWYLGFVNGFLANSTPYERANIEEISVDVDETKVNEEVLLCV